jgi:hypothetical protein
MRASILLSLVTVHLIGFHPLHANDNLPEAKASVQTAKQEQKQHRLSFTGKLTKDRVRMRLQPSLDSYVFKELSRDDLVLVTAEVEEFYAVMPPKQLKGYIFRTYVLDGVVEGQKVNVRLDPDITSPVVTQLNTGDTVQGVIAAQNNKWLQIELPDDVRFYVAKDFVEKAGDAAHYWQHEDRQKTLQARLTEIHSAVRNELAKPFAKIDLSQATTELHDIIQKNKEFPKETEEAESILVTIQKEYLAKSITAPKAQTTKQTLTEQKNSEQAPKQTKQQTQPQETATITSTNTATNTSVTATSSKAAEQKVAPANNSLWKEKETLLIQAALAEGKTTSEEAFYAQAASEARKLSGIIKPYNSFVKNRPGDFVLLNTKTNLPVAYLYSTKIDLQSYINKEVTVYGAERPNNNFAFDAYIVLNVEG